MLFPEKLHPVDLPKPLQTRPSVSTQTTPSRDAIIHPTPTPSTPTGVTISTDVRISTLIDILNTTSIPPSDPAPDTLKVAHTVAPDPIIIIIIKKKKKTKKTTLKSTQTGPCSSISSNDFTDDSSARRSDVFTPPSDPIHPHIKKIPGRMHYIPLIQSQLFF